MSDLCTINGIRDLDDDRVADLLAVHLEEITDVNQSGNNVKNLIQIISGQSGKIMRSFPTPHQEDIYVPLQLVTQYDGTESILVATGGQNTPGGLYLINIFAAMQEFKEVSSLSNDVRSGYLVETDPGHSGSVL